jgi:hypothetical protein
MKFKCLGTIVCFFASFIAFAQTVHFTYDASGNRTHRWVETKDLKDPAADTTFKLGKEFWPSDTLWVLSKVNVFPNPVAHELNVVISKLGQLKATALVCDVQGRPVLSVPVLTASNGLQLQNLARGTYFLKIECNTERRVWKIIKE